MHTKEHAFTLVELLVVIAIIGILATIAVPAVGMALERARFTESKVNLKNIGIALHSYAVDNDQNFPMVPQGDMPFNASGAADSDDASSWMTQLVPYLGAGTDEASVTSAAQKLFGSKYAARHNPKGAEKWGYFFGSHAAGAVEDAALAPLNIRRVRFPAKHILGGEVLKGGALEDSNKNDYDGSPAFALNERGVMTNVLFVDGHVAPFPTALSSLKDFDPNKEFSVTYGGPDDPAPNYFKAQ